MHETIIIESHTVNCVCDASTPYSQITRSDLERVCPSVEPQLSDVIISSGEYSHITYMRECVVTFEFRGVLFRDTRLLIRESEVRPGSGILLGRDVLSKLQG